MAQGFLQQNIYPLTLVVIPLEQGLKPQEIEAALIQRGYTLVVIPLEQGLKPISL